jgi:hypothetical protein
MFRIRETKKGFVVEHKKWFRWKPFVLVSGMDEPWYHLTWDFAMDNLLDKVKWDTQRINL